MMEEKVLAKLEILLMGTGEVRVGGPIQDRTLCYGILEMARDAIYEFSTKQRESNIIVPQMPIAAIKGGKQ